MTESQSIILSIVRRHSTPSSGWCTADIAQFVGRQPGRESNRRHSAWVLQELCTLEVLGHVRRLDDDSPIVWTATNADMGGNDGR